MTKHSALHLLPCPLCGAADAELFVRPTVDAFGALTGYHEPTFTCDNGCQLEPEQVNQLCDVLPTPQG